MAELAEARGGFSVGTTGTIVEVLDTEAIVEILDEDDEYSAALVAVPYAALRVR